jgi:predicted metalloprotease
MAGVLASSLFAGALSAGAAQAATVAGPGFKPALTKSPLYKTGKLGFETCEEPQVQSGSLDEARLYFEALLGCLDKAWGPKVKKAGFTFTKPKFRVITKPDKQGKCGGFPQGGGVQAIYCRLDKTITFLLTPQIVEEPTDLQLMATLAHEYGHHLQYLTGMFKALDTSGKRTEARYLEESRRVELQAQCLSGAFIGSIWGSLGRPESDYRLLLKAKHGLGLGVIGVRDSADETHASNPANSRWIKRGFDAKSAGGCNTWTAAKSQVS